MMMAVLSNLNVLRQTHKSLLEILGLTGCAVDVMKSPYSHKTTYSFMSLNRDSLNEGFLELFLTPKVLIDL